MGIAGACITSCAICCVGVPQQGCACMADLSAQLGCRAWHAAKQSTSDGTNVGLPSCCAALEAGVASDGEGPGSDEEEGGPAKRRRGNAGTSAREEAIRTMQRGDGVLAEGRYRDQSFFLSHNKEGR
jgi:hypothetical protein